MCAPSTLSFLLVIYLTLTTTTATNNKNERSLQKSAIELSPFSVHLTSTYKSQNGEFLAELRKETIQHLESVFWVWYNSEESNSIEYVFREINLEIDSFRLNENRKDASKYFASVSFTGVAYFDSDEVPSQNIVNDLQLDAFQGNMLQSFMKNLQLTSDEYLQGLKGLSVKFSASESARAGEESSSNNKLMLSAVVGVVLGFVSFLTIMFFYIYVCRRKKNTDESFSKENVFKEEYPNEDISGIEEASTHSMSLASSGASASSSKFTYNPHSVFSSIFRGGFYNGSKSVISKETTGTKNTIDLNVNVDAWKAADPNRAQEVECELEPDVSVISGNSTIKTIDTFVINPSSPYSKKKKSGRKFTADDCYLSKETLKERAGLPQSHGERPNAPQKQDKSVIIELDESFRSEQDEENVVEDLQTLSVLFKKHRSSESKSNFC